MVGESIGEQDFLTGNNLTRFLHQSTYAELLKPGNSPFFTPKKVVVEKSVLIQNGGLREGRFDFFVESAEGKFIGVEVLTRVSRAKLRKKLAYARQTDEFIFVLPSYSLELYRKKEKHGLAFSSRKKFLDFELGAKNIFVWLYDIVSKKFVAKNVFSNEFNVKKN